MKPEKIVSELIKISEIRNSFELDRTVSSKSFGLPPNSVIFSGENLSVFNNLIEKLYQYSSAIKETYTLKKFTSIFFEEFRIDFENENTPNKSKIDNFFDKLKEKEIVSYYVFREIFGIKFDSNISHLNFGAFTVYNYANHKSPIEELHKGDLAGVFPDNEPRYLVRFDAKARHFERAIEIADEYLKRFEATLNFCTGKSKQVEIGIFNYLGIQKNRTLVLNESGIRSEAYKSEGPSQEIAIDDNYFKIKENGFHEIWDLISKATLTEIESKIILSIDWIGQAINERAPTDSFLKAAIALEILLTYNEKIPITPSITYRLSESTALILGTTVESRIKIEKKVKELYSRRSAIVHSGKNSVKESEIHHMITYVRAIIIQLITDSELKKIKTIQNLYSYLRKLKYE